jgi:hypothetical protein
MQLGLLHDDGTKHDVSDPREGATAAQHGEGSGNWCSSRSEDGAGWLCAGTGRGMQGEDSGREELSRRRHQGRRRGTVDAGRSSG